MFLRFRGIVNRTSIAVTTMAHSRRSRLHEFDNSKELSYLEKQILKFLHDHCQSPSSPIETLKICHGVGKKTKKDINPSLYSLQKKGHIFKARESPPLWCLVRYDDIHTSSHPGTPGPAPFVSRDVTAAEFHPGDFTPSFPSTSAMPNLPRGDMKESQINEYRVYGRKNDDFVIPPTPAQLVNNAASEFRRLNLKGPVDIVEKDSMHAQLLRVLNNYHVLSMSDICTKLPDEEIDAIRQALEELQSYDKVQKIGENYSLKHVNSENFDGASPKLLYVHGGLGPARGAEKAFINEDFTSDAVSRATISNFALNDTTPAVKLTVPDGKNAISALNEYAQMRKLPLDYKERITGPDHQRRFFMTVHLGSKLYPGPEASTKKDARLKAAERVLAALYETGDVQSGSTVDAPTYLTSPREMTIHLRIATLVISKYNQLVLQLPEAITGRKIIAGFVMSRKIKSGETTYEVISIGSGNRCVAGDKLSLRGETVNDCHAEVIARRGLVRFLYKELLKLGEKDTADSIFCTYEDRYTLAPDIQFHLYISTAPCGDSAIFAPSDAATDDPSRDVQDATHHPLFENKKQGLLRTKVENGEGCIPIEEDTAAPTWDGILRGERLRTMSCSDKIAKWNFLGLQGALLSRFIEPIYMSTLTLGMLYNHGHLTRAICCRVEKFMSTLDLELQPPSAYKVHHPAVALAGHNQSRETGKIKTREYSMNWSFGDENPEVLDGTEGKCEQRFRSVNPPRICKAELFKNFQTVCAKMKSADQCQGYYYCKQVATAYQNAKNLLQYAFDKNGYGTWMSKPKEEKDFEL